MCEKRTRKIKKGSHLKRLRENRRLQRMQWLASAPSPTSSEDSNPPQTPQPVNEVAQNRVLLELAWRTVALMQKNKIIQQKLADLQKETSEFVASVMKNPENKARCMEQFKLQQAQTTQFIAANKLKTDPAN